MGRPLATLAIVFVVVIVAAASALRLEIDLSPEQLFDTAGQSELGDSFKATFKFR